MINITDSLQIDTSQIAVELSELTSINPDDVVVTVQYDDDGGICNIIVYVTEQTEANIITETVNHCRS